MARSAITLGSTTVSLWGTSWVGGVTLVVAIGAVVSGAESTSAGVTAGGGVATGDGVVSAAATVAVWGTNLSVDISVILSVMVVNEERWYQNGRLLHRTRKGVESRDLSYPSRFSQISRLLYHVVYWLQPFAAAKCFCTRNGQVSTPGCWQFSRGRSISKWHRRVGPTSFTWP